MRFPALIAIGLLVALLLSVLPPRRSGSKVPASVSSHGPGKTASPKSAQPGRPPSPPTKHAKILPAPASVTMLKSNFLHQAARDRQLHLALGDATSLSFTVTRSGQAGDGSLLFVEGTLSHPAPGRFTFRRQPAGAKPGPFDGVVFFPSLDYGYRLETAAGQPVLVRRHVDALACVDYHGPDDSDPQEIPEDHPDDIPIPGYQNGVIPLQSLPGASGVIYLDFDGEEGPHESWGDFDAASFNFSNSKIKDIWERVSEDFAPFNLNVTTDLQVYLDASETSRQRCIVTNTKDAAPGAGGVAFIGSFNWAGDTPCWGFISSTKACAEVISHEIGHTLTLGHDGRTTPSETYYGGHGSGDTGWAPIMGVGYNKNLTHWSKGEYLNANNTQDDLSRITSNNNTVDYRLDDHGATHATATPLGFAPGGSVDDEGIIETTDDTDAFLFTTTSGGALSINIDPVALGPNLDILAELYDDTDTLLESANPADDLNSTLTSTVPAGTYTVRITNTAKGDPLASGYTDYSTLGQYTLSGTIIDPVLPDFFELDENSPLNTPVGTVAARGSHGANPLSWSIASGNDLNAFQVDPLSGALTVADPAVLDVETLSPGWSDPPIFELVVDITDTIDSNLNEAIRVLITILDVNEAPTVTNAGITILEHTLVGRELLSLGATDPDEFDLVTYAITAGDPSGRFAIDSAGILSPATDLAFADQSSYTLTVTVTDSGTPGLTDSATVTVDLLDTVEGYAPGQVEHTFYRNISGGGLSGLTSDPNFPECPDDIDLRESVHANGDGDNYGRVVRTFLIPPVTGNYTLWIAGDDACQLDLSTDADPANASTIASFSGWTNYQQWNKFGSQKSALIPLVAGQPYYLEARQKEGGGGDHLSLAWEAEDPATTVILPMEPIPGLFMAPHAANYCPSIDDVDVEIKDTSIAGTLVATFAASDLNPSDTHTYEITGGNSGGKFAINSTTGQVTLVDATGLDPIYGLTITTTDNGTPALSDTAALGVLVVDGTVITATKPLMEFWDNIGGTALSDLTNSPLFPDRPERLLELTDLDSGESNGSNFGARIRAYLTPPTSGAYTFYIASDDNGEVLLSTDDTPANAVQICEVPVWTSYLQWDKYPLRQTSDPINLVGGQRYFIEGRVKEASGGDHLAVGWTGPGISTITVIESSLLEPYDSNVAPALSPLASTVDLPANPIAGTSLLSFSATDSPFETVSFGILAGDEEGAFAISPNGELTLADPNLLHSGPYTLTIGAQDSGHGGYFLQKTTSTTVTVYLDDADHDLLPDPWELAQFGNLAEDGATDTDLDNLSNRAEYLFGTLANDAQSFPRPESTGSWTATTAEFSYVVRNDAPPGSYLLYSSTDHATWTALTPAEFTVVGTATVDANHDRITVDVTISGTQRYLKLGVD